MICMSVVTVDGEALCPRAVCCVPTVYRLYAVTNRTRRMDRWDKYIDRRFYTPTSIKGKSTGQERDNSHTSGPV